MAAKHVPESMKTHVIHIKYRHMGGQHVFTSEQVRGLYVASADARNAFDSVPPVVAELVRIKTGIKCHAEMAATFDEFLASAQNPSVTLPEPILTNREVLIRCEA